MFTGIIKEVGQLKKRESTGDKYQLVIAANQVLDRVSLGDSIAVNGVCLTVVDFTDKEFKVDVMPGTLTATNLSELSSGSVVNLEPAVTPDSFLGGHLVTGHVDGTGRVVNITTEKNAKLVKISFNSNLAKYLVDKGSVALNGVSLTIYKLEKDKITVSLIPETWEQTTFNNTKIGDMINIETDIIGKYVARLLNFNDSNESNDSNIDMDFLKENGFI